MKKLKFILFCVLPIILLYLGFFMKNERPDYYINCIDAEYAYLFNGLNISQLASPWHVIGPGTPLQVLSFIVITIVHLFHNHDPLLVDVFKNPELYLSAINFSLNLIESIVLFFIGFVLFKETKNIFAGLFIQLMPFISWQLLDFSRRIMVENLVIAGIICLYIVIFKYINYQDTKSKLVDKYLIWFSIIVGFITSAKLMYAPIAIVPFLLLPGYKKKKRFVLFSIISFAILSFPIFIYWKSFGKWYFENFFHSGFYGSGSSTIIDLKYFFANLKQILTNGSIFTYSFFLIISGCILYHIQFFKVKQKNDKFYLILLGTALNMILMLLLVSKQFKNYYLASALLVVVPGLYLLITIYSRPFKRIRSNVFIIPAFAIIAFCAYYKEIKNIFNYHQENLNLKQSYASTSNFIATQYGKNNPTLVIADYYGAPYKEYAYFFGLYWCGEKMKNKYVPVLEELYPNTYIYHDWSNMFNFNRDKLYTFQDLLKKYQSVVLYSGDPSKEKLLSSKLHGLNRQIDTKFKTVYHNNKTKETIYEVTYDSIVASKITQYCCNAELLDSTGSNFINENQQLFENGITQSSEKRKSGKYSSKLTKDLPYGMTAVLSEVKANEHYKFSVWEYNNNNPEAGLAVSALDATKYFFFERKTVKKEGDWVKIEIEFTVPEDLNNQDIKIFCWDNDKELPAYFDDFQIEKL
jgi:hypothetical protein